MKHENANNLTFEYQMSIDVIMFDYYIFEFAFCADFVLCQNKNRFLLFLMIMRCKEGEMSVYGRHSEEINCSSRIGIGHRSHKVREGWIIPQRPGEE